MRGHFMHYGLGAHSKVQDKEDDAILERAKLLNKGKKANTERKTPTNVEAGPDAGPGVGEIPS